MARRDIGRAANSMLADRELITLAKTMTLDEIAGRTGRKPEAILRTARRLSASIKDRPSEP
jgi:hypothetical protein